MKSKKGICVGYVHISRVNHTILQQPKLRPCLASLLKHMFNVRLDEVFAVCPNMCVYNIIMYITLYNEAICSKHQSIVKPSTSPINHYQPLNHTEVPPNSPIEETICQRSSESIDDVDTIFEQKKQ